MIGPILAVIIIGVVATLLVRKFNPQAVLLLSGLLMLMIAHFLGNSDLSLQKPTGNSFFDFFALIKEAFSKINAGVGLMIMAIGGFVAYMKKIGASDVLVYWSMKPLSLFKKQPYIASSLVIPIGQVLFIAIPSAAGLSLLLMASLFPILIQLGVSRLSAVSVITASTVFGIGPACATTASAIEILDLDTVIYFVDYQIPLVWPMSILLTVSYYFVNKYFDKKEKNTTNNDAIEIKDAEKKPTSPAIYLILPLLPIILLLVFSEIFGAQKPLIVLDTTTVMFMSLIAALLFETIRHRQWRSILESLNVFWSGMGDIFKSVVTLIITAEVFAKGLIHLGFIDGLIALTQGLGLGAIGIGVIMTMMIYLSSMLMGSGNAAFFSFGPLVPGMASQIGLNSVNLMLPMQLAASMGRAISPVSGVLIATSQIAGLSSLQVAKRNFIPITVTLLFMLIYHFV